jgi:hypothetical protein
MSKNALRRAAITILGFVGLFAASLSAQPAFTCNATGGARRIVRETGLAELVGDVVLNCTGGTPTPQGSPIPEYTVQLSLNTNVTNRIFPQASQLTEALLIVDEAFPATPIPSNALPVTGAPHQILCTAMGGTCGETGTGGRPSPYQTQPNVFVGLQPYSNGLEWTIPIDAPGTTGVRIIRITNVRANAAELGGGGIIPTTITAILGASPALTIYGPLVGVAISEQGLYSSLNPGTGLLQCVPHNASLLGGSGTAAFDFSVQVQEGFASAFKFRNYGTVVYGPEFPQQLSEQNVPGFSYYTESGFYSPSLFTAVPTVGLADFGTRIRVAFQGVTAGTHLFVPVTIGAQAVGCSPAPDCSTRGQLQLVQAGKSGNSLPGYKPVPATATIGTTPVAEVNYSGSVGYATYEITNADSTITEVATIPVAVAFNSSTVPAIGVTEVNASFAPINTIATADPAAPLPRFADPFASQTAYAINSCPATPLSGRIASKSGPQNARVWSIEVDSGASPAFGASIDGFTLTQTAGTACTPVVTNPSNFPLTLGYIPKKTSAAAPITIDFTGCGNAAQFNVNIPLSANDGTSTGVITRTNAYR